MRFRWRGIWLFASLIGLICITALGACANGSTSKPVTGATATTGPITVTTNLTAYSTNDPIGVTVSNTSITDYFAVSGKSACVIIQLERYDRAKSAWVPMDLCASPAIAQPYAIAKNSQEQFTLAPNSSADPNAWPAGLYRVSVTYSTNTDGVSNPQLAHCAAFNIK